MQRCTPPACFLLFSMQRFVEMKKDGPLVHPVNVQKAKITRAVMSSTPINDALSSMRRLLIDNYPLNALHIFHGITIIVFSLCVETACLFIFCSKLYIKLKIQQVRPILIFSESNICLTI